MVALRNSCRVAEGVPGKGARGEGGGGDRTDPGETEPDEHGVEPPQYLKNVVFLIQYNLHNNTLPHRTSYLTLHYNLHPGIINNYIKNK